MSSLKRKRQELTSVSDSLTVKQQELTSVFDSLAGEDLLLYKLIHSKEGMGIWTADMKRETNLPERVFQKSLKSLISKDLIKNVVNIQNKGKKHYIASEFEPSSEITGGEWYNEGTLDTDFINLLKDACWKYIFRQKISTPDGVLEWSRNSGIFSAQVTTQQIQEILKTLLLDDEIVEVKSTGVGEFASVPKGKICYKCKCKGGVRGEQKHAAFTDIPCGVCPRIKVCTLDGIVSPTCVYYQKWLDF